MSGNVIVPIEPNREIGEVRVRVTLDGSPEAIETEREILETIGEVLFRTRIERNRATEPRTLFIRTDATIRAIDAATKELTPARIPGRHIPLLPWETWTTTVVGANLMKDPLRTALALATLEEIEREPGEGVIACVIFGRERLIDFSPRR